MGWGIELKSLQFWKTTRDIVVKNRIWELFYPDSVTDINMNILKKNNGVEIVIKNSVFVSHNFSF